MTPDQIALVRASWATAVANADDLTTAFYRHLFAIDASAARLFAGVDLDSQRKKLAQSLVLVVHALEDPDRLLPALAALGKRHVHYGVEHRHFDNVGEALLLALSDTLGDAFTPGTRDAWNDAYALIASVMRRALMNAERNTSQPLTHH